MKHHLYLLLALLITNGIGLTSAKTKPASEIKADETLVFFNTSAWLNEQTNHWHIPIHGWIYEPEDSIVRKNLIAKALTATYRLTATEQSQPLFDQRVNLLLADNERGKSIVIRFANRTYALPNSKPNGHFKKTLLVDAKVLTEANIQKQLSYEAVLSEQDQRTFSGQVNLITPKGTSIISDIDDTIKISEVTNRRQLLNHTFLLNFKAVSGIAELYTEWLKDEGSLHFVSSTPWQLYPVVKEFIEQSEFPDADYALKAFRFKDKTLMNLFASSLETKPPQIIAIIKRYPERKFILVGDSGEKDPEIYAQIQQQFPQQIIKILIRNVTAESADNDRFQTLFKGLSPNMWQLFNKANEIKILP